MTVATAGTCAGKDVLVTMDDLLAKIRKNNHDIANLQGAMQLMAEMLCELRREQAEPREGGESERGGGGTWTA